jgi:hypothetical protein
MPIRSIRMSSWSVQQARHGVVSSPCQFVAFHLGPLLIHLPYFVAIDLLGFLARPGASCSRRTTTALDTSTCSSFMSTSPVKVTVSFTSQKNRVANFQSIEGLGSCSQMFIVEPLTLMIFRILYVRLCFVCELY